MRYLILALVALVFGQACKKDAVRKIQDGAYSGTFTRTGPLSNHVASNVQLTFSANRFSGTSDIRNYPAICNGTYKAGASTLEATNECVFTTDFDGTFIFNGEYEYTLDGDELRLTRRYSNSTYVDRYFLKRIK